MDNIIIQIENLSKKYRTGYIGAKTLREEFILWYSKILGRENPLTNVGKQVSERIEEESVYALRNIDLIVKKGTILGIIGENGAGKSTLLKILSRITGPTTGTVKIDGRVGSLLEVGTGFHPELTGRENIYLNGSILGMQMHEIDAKLNEIIEFSGVGKYIDTPIKRYSSGMKVRLGFSVAAFLEPEVLVIDEVLAVGDELFRVKAIDKLKNLIKDEGRTILFVSHNMNSIKEICSEAIVLREGEIVFRGSPNDAVDHYLADCSRDKFNSNIDTTIFDRQENPQSSLSMDFCTLISGDRQTNRIVSGAQVEFQITTQAFCKLVK